MYQLVCPQTIDESTACLTFEHVDACTECPHFQTHFLDWKWICQVHVEYHCMMTSSNGNISAVPVNSPHKGQWRGALMFSVICVWINGWVNNREAGDFRRYRTHYDVIVMEFSPQWSNWQYFNIGPGNGSVINRRMKQCSPNSLPPYVNTRFQKSSSQQRKLQSCVSPTFYVARLLHTNGHIYKIRQCDHFMPICQRVSSL